MNYHPTERGKQAMRRQQLIEPERPQRLSSWAPGPETDLEPNPVRREEEATAGMKVFSTSLTLSTSQRTEVSDITPYVRDAVRQSLILSGIALVNTLHTTCALLVNEFQAALIADLNALFEQLVPERSEYRHNDPRVSDCERGNAHSHLRAALFGRNVAVGVVNGEIMLGQFQSVIFAEFDGPRKREIAVRIIGA